MQPWALSLPEKELCLREALAVCTPPAPEPKSFKPHTVNLRAVDWMSVCPRISLEVTVHVYLSQKDSSLEMKDWVCHFRRCCRHTDLSCQPPTRTASAEETFHTQDHLLSQGAPHLGKNCCGGCKGPACCPNSEIHGKQVPLPKASH